MVAVTKVWRSASRNLWNFLRAGGRGRRLRQRLPVASGLGWSVAAEVMEARELLTAGVIDVSFGQNGTANMPSPESGNPHSYFSVVQANGEIVTLGNVASDGAQYGEDVLITRFTVAGALDKTFGKKGYETVSFGSYSRFEPKGMLREANGKFLVYGGDAPNWLINSNNWNGVVLQFTANGTLDTSFGKNGELIITPAGGASGSSHVLGAALDPQGRFVMMVSNPSAVGGGTYLMRLNSNGTADSTFGPNGILPTNLPSDFNSIDVVAAPSDPAGYDILLAGSSYGGAATTSQSIYWYVKRLTSSGALDASFGTNGMATINLPLDATVADPIYSANLRGLNIDSSGRIYLNGFEQIREQLPDGSFSAPVQIDPATARITASGALDTTYANGGVGLIPTTLQINNEDMQTTIDSQGRIIVIMTATQSSSSKIGVMLRYTPSGAIDTTFGTAGSGYVFLNSWTSGIPLYNGITVAPDGKLVVTGLSFVNRYLGS
jgi:uncharacterized delta-60 repeat protein